MKYANQPTRWHILKLQHSQQSNSNHTMMLKLMNTDKHTQDHTNKLPCPQTGNTNPFNNTSCQTHPEVKVIHCNDPNNDNPNLNQIDSLCSIPTLYSPVTQQQLNKDSPILYLTQANHCSNHQPGLNKIKEEILQSLKQMTGHPTSQSIQAPIDFDKMIEALEQRTHKMTVNTACYPLAPYHGCPQQAPDPSHPLKTC